jgi:hypothetical protein
MVAMAAASSGSGGGGNSGGGGGAQRQQQHCSGQCSGQCSAQGSAQGSRREHQRGRKQSGAAKSSIQKTHAIGVQKSTCAGGFKRFKHHQHARRKGGRDAELVGKLLGGAVRLSAKCSLSHTQSWGPTAFSSRCGRVLRSLANSVRAEGAVVRWAPWQAAVLHWDAFLCSGGCYGAGQQQWRWR